MAKEYRYQLSRRSVLPPALAPAAVRVDPDLDVDRMRTAAALIEGHHDFSAFAKTGGAHTQPWRRVFDSRLLEDGPELVYRCLGDGFLRGMVRALVGTLLWVGKGRTSLDDFVSLLEGGSRSDAGPSAPARGLCLARVFYPDEGGWS